MALDPSTRYPGQIDTTDPAGYPYGKARNRIVDGDGVGTPYERDLVNDIFGFQQAILDAVGATPSNTPDKVGASQYLDALRKIFASANVQQFAFTPNAQVKALGADILEDIFSHPNGSEFDSPLIMAVGGATSVLRSHRGDTWIVESAVLPQNGRSIAARGTDVANVVWVVVGSLTSISTSVDGGQSWTDQSANSAILSGSLHRVRWGNGLFVCLGNSDEIQTSPNGVAWTARTNPSAKPLHDLHYSAAAGIWVAVGNDGAVITSIDGITWTDRTGLSVGTADFRSVVYDEVNELWIAGGIGSVQTTADPDTENWVDRTAEFGFASTQEIASLAVDGEGVTLATRRSGSSGDNVDGIGFSRDGGLTWVVRNYDFAQPVGGAGAALWEAIFVDGRWFIAAGDSGDDGMILVSPRR